MAFAMTIDSQWQLFAVCVCISAPTASWLASIIDVGKGYIFAVPFFVLLFSVPAINLCLNLSYVSGSGPVQTYAKMAPIAGGIGWALTFLVGERLFYQQLFAAQNLVYIIYSIRSRLDWALDCGHSYNSQFCVNFTDTLQNNTINQSNDPHNHWPAQEFNRYEVRGQDIHTNVSQWLEDGWYSGAGENSRKYYITWPPLVLSLAHLCFWTLLFIIVSRYRNEMGRTALRYFVLAPIGLLVLLTVAMAIVGFDFTNVVTAIANASSDHFNGESPLAYRSLFVGMYQVSLATIDTSMAFTGLLIFVASLHKPLTTHAPTTLYAALIIAVLQLVGPLLFATLRLGCFGHLKQIQPNYIPWHTNEAVFAFDTFAVCAATCPFGSLWAFIYYVATLFYGSIGPMFIFIIFLHTTLIEQFTIFDRYSNHVLAAICGFYAFFGLFLCMPLGTVVTTLFNWLSESTMPEMIALFVVLFVYGWNTLNIDVALVLDIRTTTSSIMTHLFGPTSAIYTALLFTAVPTLLATKFVSVFDYLMGGHDIVRHIDHATNFISESTFFNRLIGYAIVMTPMSIIVFGGCRAIYRFARNKMELSAVLAPASEWQLHTRLSDERERQRSIAPLPHRIFTVLCPVSYRTALFGILIIECMILLIITILTIMNSILTIHLWIEDEKKSTSTANTYRAILLIILWIVHIFAIWQIRHTIRMWNSARRLDIYLAIACAETSLLNGYLWMFAFTAHGQFVFVPFYAIIVNCLFRCTLMAIVIAIRWNISEISTNRDDDTTTQVWTENIVVVSDMDDLIDETIIQPPPTLSI